MQPRQPVELVEDELDFISVQLPTCPRCKRELDTLQEQDYRFFERYIQLKRKLKNMRKRLAWSKK